MRLREFLVSVNLAALAPTGAGAHVSEQGFVLLLPTGAYTIAGVAAVALTVLALFAIPGHFVQSLFQSKPIRSPDLGKWANLTSLVSFLIMGFLVYVGLFGPRDPLSNLMPLVFWTLGWIALVSLAAVFGNVWNWINPWTGLFRLLGPVKPTLRLPEVLGVWPATLVLAAFAAFLLADIAPDDPARLAQLVSTYWAVIFAGLLLFGPKWLDCAELGHALFAAYSSLAPVRLRTPTGIGAPGWQILTSSPHAAAGIFALTLLAVGSFDGMNETFYWLGLIGVNPLEFPGRSAVIGVTLLGLFGFVLGLFAIFSIAVWLGLRLGGMQVRFSVAFGWLALSLLPIALVYHVAHYLTSFMVSIQYTIAALSDPFARGADWLGIQPFRVTTGFLNHIDTVRFIWTTQAGLVVLGHVWSVLLSHLIALRLFKDGPSATIAILPLSLFMIGYTFLGLCLLAAPKGA